MEKTARQVERRKGGGGRMEVEVTWWTPTERRARVAVSAGASATAPSSTTMERPPELERVRTECSERIGCTSRCICRFRWLRALESNTANRAGKGGEGQCRAVDEVMWRGDGGGGENIKTGEVESGSRHDPKLGWSSGSAVAVHEDMHSML